MIPPVWVDTGAVLAVLDAGHPSHTVFASTYGMLVDSGSPLATSDYVVVELAALLPRDLGREALRMFAADVLPILDLRWADPQTHRAAFAALLASAADGTSLVDHVSFEIMRRDGIRTALSPDDGFRRQGFEVLP